MKDFKVSRPSPAMVVSVVAMSLALIGTAVAAPAAVERAITKSKVKRIAKKQANKVVSAREASLNVNSAKTADSATTATNATNAQNATNAENAVNATNATNAQNAASANPIAYALVSSTGAVDEASSKGVTDANVFKPAEAGRYCFRGLSFTPKAGQATVDFGDAGSEYAQFGIPGTDSAFCVAGDQAVVGTTDEVGDFSDAGFYVVFYD